MQVVIDRVSLADNLSGYDRPLISEFSELRLDYWDKSQEGRHNRSSNAASFSFGTSVIPQHFLNTKSSFTKESVPITLHWWDSTDSTWTSRTHRAQNISLEFTKSVTNEVQNHKMPFVSIFSHFFLDTTWRRDVTLLTKYAEKSHGQERKYNISEWSQN